MPNFPQETKRTVLRGFPATTNYRKSESEPVQGLFSLIVSTPLKPWPRMDTGHGVTASRSGDSPQIRYINSPGD